MKMLSEEKRHYTAVVHTAIVFRVNDEIDLAKAKDILAAVQGTVDLDTTDTDDCLPLWLHFDAVDGAELRLLIGHAPGSKTWIDGLAKSVPGVSGVTRVSRYDHEALRSKKKKKKPATPSRVARPDRPKDAPKVPVRDNGPNLNPTLLPIQFKFFACEEAYKECEKLGETLSRWPLYGFLDADLKKWMEGQVRRLPETYPYIHQADQAIGGKLSKAMLALGNNPHQPPFERNRFWMVIRKAAVCSFERMADELLAVIEKGKGDHTRFEEEKADKYYAM